MINRRFFLGGVLVLAATPVIVKYAPLFIATPIIKGNGEWDDWAGLQALLRNEPFEVESSEFTAREGLIANGTFRISQPLRMRYDFEIRGCEFKAEKISPTAELFQFDKGSKGVVRYTRFQRQAGHEPIICDEWRPKS